MLRNDSIELKELMSIIKNKWKTIIGIILIFFIVSVIFNFFIMKIDYKADMTIFVGSSTTKTSVQEMNIEMYQSMIQTYLKKEDKETLVKNAIKTSGLNLNVNEAVKDLLITPKIYSNAFEIAYLDTNKEVATLMAQNIASNMVNEAEAKNPNGDVYINGKILCTKKPVIHKRMLNVGIITLLGIIVGFGVAILSGLKSKKA
ncbi:Wzz/FepE/Etk N-terminal domain-containing protein [uncultured Clostridium sp.]|uniref:Wzz/FepE/Etk N-terminal domain-containing protein n=1 Tax=uncultured Clostridium sp. TaxID=59620 RepID=UPI00261DEAEA|nr:Wzz/FepE/Etk N-terminal domain-containing protein [uncultured Clostridium sp.]